MTLPSFFKSFDPPPLPPPLFSHPEWAVARAKCPTSRRHSPWWSSAPLERSGELWPERYSRTTGSLSERSPGRRQLTRPERWPKRVSTGQAKGLESRHVQSPAIRAKLGPSSILSWPATSVIKLIIFKC